MITHHRAAAIAALTCSLGLIGSCASASEKVSEKLSEKVIESAAEQGVDVEFDGEGGELSIDGENGSSINVGGTTLPEDWPADVPMPEGFTVTTASSFSGTGALAFISVAGTSAVGVDETMAHFADALAGWATDADSTGSSSTGDNQTGVWNQANRNVIVNVSRDGNGDTEVNITYSAGAER